MNNALCDVSGWLKCIAADVCKVLQMHLRVVFWDATGIM